MLKVLRRVSAAYVAYVFLLAAFVSLGGFVAALASGSDWAVVAGVVLIACLGGAVTGFRTGARQLAQSRQSGDLGNNVSIFSVPLRRDEVDRYHENYRTDRGNVAQPARALSVVAGAESREQEVSPAIGRKRARTRAAAPNRLSA